MSESSQASLRGLLSSRRFLPLFVTQFFTAFNDNLYKNALIALLTYGVAAGHLNQSLRDQGVMLAGVLFVLPYFLFSASAGKLADRLEKTRIVRWVKILEIGMMLLGGYAFFFAQFWLLFAVVFLMGTHSAFFSPVKYGILPQYLRSHELVLGNALIEAATFAAIVAGTAIGTQLVLLPEVGNHYIAGLLTITALLGYWTCLSMPPAPPMQTNDKARVNPWRDTVDMLRELPHYPQSVRCILANTWFWFVSIILMSLFPLYVGGVLRMNHNVYTFLLILFAVGVGGGSMACAALLRGRLSAGYTPIAALGMAVCAAGLGYYDFPLYGGAALGGIADFFATASGWGVAACMTMVAFFGGAYAVPFFALLQNGAPDGKQSFMFGANNIINAAGMTTAVVLLVLAQKIGMSIGNIFYATAFLCAIGAWVLHHVIDDSVLRMRKKS